MNVASSLETYELLVCLPLYHRPLQIRVPLSALGYFCIGHDTLVMLAASWGEVNRLKSAVNMYSYGFSVLYMNHRQGSICDNSVVIIVR